MENSCHFSRHFYLENKFLTKFISTLHYRIAVYTHLFFWTVECTLNDSTCLLIFEKSGQNAQKCAILTNVLNKMYYYKIVHAKYIFKIC